MVPVFLIIIIAYYITPSERHAAIYDRPVKLE
jgi:hypothetical protein